MSGWELHRHPNAFLWVGKPESSGVFDVYCGVSANDYSGPSPFLRTVMPLAYAPYKNSCQDVARAL